MKPTVRHKEVVTSTLGANSKTIRAYHLGCEDHPTFCQMVIFDFDRHVVSFNTTVKDKVLSRQSFSFHQISVMVTLFAELLDPEGLKEVLEAS